MNPEPRILLIVLALAGDSTMTTALPEAFEDFLRCHERRGRLLRRQPSGAGQERQQES